MEQWSWDYGVKWLGKKSKRLIEIQPMTTHKLEWHAQERQWRCACGYKLGDGRKQFLARCRLAGKAYAENSVSSASSPPASYAKPKRKARRAGADISRRVSDLFDL